MESEHDGPRANLSHLQKAISETKTYFALFPAMKSAKIRFGSLAKLGSSLTILLNFQSALRLESLLNYWLMRIRNEMQRKLRYFMTNFS